jgi:superfamily I DNA/RNA helicase
MVETEIARRKDARLENTYEYLDDLHIRHRGLTEDQQNALCFLFDLYREYQESLKNGGQESADWEDVQQLTLNELHGHKLQRSYDAIFIDEAQDFSPQMMEIVKRLIRPGGYLFMCDDPVQCLWREFNWREKHIHPDKEETLSYPLRTTQSIMNVAQGLLDAEPKMKSDHDWNTYPSPKHENVDIGNMPDLIPCGDNAEEQRVVEQIVRNTLEKVTELDGIAILCPTSYQSEAWSKLDWIAETNTYVSHFNRIKGLEFDVIIIPHLETLLNYKQSIDQTRIILPLRKLFVAVTRARRYLHVTYTGQLPTQLRVLEHYMVKSN